MGRPASFDEAEKKISNAWWAALVSAGITAVFASISLGGEPIAGIDEWAFLDVLLILGLAYGLSRRSRTCAVLLFVYFVLGKVAMWVETQSVKGLPLALLFMYYFGQGMVGTFQYHNLEASGETSYRPAGRTSGTPWLVWTILAGVIVAGAGAGWYFKPSRQLEAEAARPPTRQEIEAQVASAVGRLNRVEMSGSVLPLSAAIAIEEGVMMVPCRGITPGAHLFVKLGARDLQAKLETAEQGAGLCRLALKEHASGPLPVAPAPPKVGDAVFATTFDPSGRIVLAAGQVKNVVRVGRGTVIESSARATEAVEGSPLLDSTGRLLAISLEGRDTTLPASWVPAR